MAVTGSLFLLRTRILWAAGQVLVDSESPRKVDAVVVLGGDWTGSRVLKGAELVRQGYAPRMVISNGPLFYGHWDSEIAADFAAAHGYSRETMICIHETNDSTASEAELIPATLRTLRAHSILLVTSPSHTGRATRIFRRAAPDLEFHPVAAPDRNWCGGRWWTERECRKTWFFEMVKTVTQPAGL